MNRHPDDLSPDFNRAHTEAPGLRPFGPGDFVDPGAQWTPEMTEKATWAVGQEQALLPTDLVVRFSSIEGPLCGRAGFALLRGGRIVAERTTWLS